MSLVALAQSIRDMLNATRPELRGGPVGLNTALVSDLTVGDYLVGCRCTVTATGATVSGNRTITIQRLGGVAFNVAWPAAQSVVIQRGA